MCSQDEKKKPYLNKVVVGTENDSDLVPWGRNSRRGQSLAVMGSAQGAASLAYAQMLV